jgi:hypothetical protein
LPSVPRLGPSLGFALSGPPRRTSQASAKPAAPLPSTPHRDSLSAPPQSASQPSAKPAAPCLQPSPEFALGPSPECVPALSKARSPLPPSPHRSSPSDPPRVRPRPRQSSRGLASSSR